MCELQEDGVLSAEEEDGLFCDFAEKNGLGDGLVDCDGLQVLLVEGGVGRGSQARDGASHDGRWWRECFEEV